MPASYVKLLLVDRETKNAVAGIAFVFVAVLLLAHSASPAPTRKSDEASRSVLPSVPSAATPAMWTPAAHPGQTSWSAPTLLAAYAAPSRAAPFFYKGDSNDREQALDCLAAASWYEAGDDPEGQKSVIQVVLNRVRHPSFPSTVCGVVFQGSERTTGCQFTFTCDGSMQRRFPSAAAWKRARQLSEKALEGAVDTDVGQATHYHADYVSPWWSDALQRVSQIGVHIFYRWPGGRGKFVSNRNFGTEADALASASIEQMKSGPRIASQPGMLVRGPVEAAAAVAEPVISPEISQARLMAIDPQSPSGRWAMTALDRCAGQSSCSVIAYGQQAELDRNTNLKPDQMERPIFLFVRDPASRMELALWDCDRVARPQESQCLPKDGKALAHLMRNR